LTIVSGGTSLPELATSVTAAVRGERDIAVGNVIGSNIFNTTIILGVTGLFAPGGIAVSEVCLTRDIPVMVAASFLCLPVFLTGKIVSRREGFLFLAAYGGYTLWTIWTASAS
jgi:cation:H+ antiporter